ncbi:MAG: O-antigen ligase domain-containing protein [Actinomycetota bacterium]|nr:O-antigen ligase domain-containing protein [Actinomycetota bacterium]
MGAPSGRAGIEHACPGRRHGESAVNVTGTGAGPRIEPDCRDQQGTPPLVGLVWALLVFNTLGSVGVATIVPIPRSLLQMITMGSLGVAFMLALLLNPRLRVRPSAFLLLLSLLLVVSVASSSPLESGLGALVRCARLAVFLATLWLLTRWWNGSLTFVRYHVRAVGAVLGTVVLGLVIAPGTARPADFDNRLIGVLWPITATQVADYAAVVAGLTLVLWLARSSSGWSVVGIALPAIILLILTHTRTATVGLVAAVPVAGLTLALANARARRALAVAALGAGLIAVAFAAPLVNWFQRGQDEEALSNLTGRQKVWDLLLAAERTPREQLFGVGLTDKSFAGLPIDSTWLTVYYEQGLVGVVIIVVLSLGLVFAAATRPPSPARACAVFLIVYCLIASYTQVGLGDVSGYLLHFVVAAALLTGAGPTVRVPIASARMPP